MDSVTVNPRNRSGKPLSITDAQPSRAEELHHREVRYVLMMSFRAVCLVVATVLVYTHVPLLAIWLPILLLGMLVVPWLAVILANDRSPKSYYRKLGRRHPVGVPDQRAITRGEEPKTIDADPDD
jgi:Flp pilus assembly protein TadB